MLSTEEDAVWIDEVVVRTEIDRIRSWVPPPAAGFFRLNGGVGGSSELKDRHLNTELSSSVRGVEASGVKADGL